LRRKGLALGFPCDRKSYTTVERRFNKTASGRRHKLEAAREGLMVGEWSRYYREAALHDLQVLHAHFDELMTNAINAGGRDAMPAQDHGFMYARSFYDLDGHHWEVLWMDPKAVELGPEAYMASRQK
jgi:hypothetical protein